jgi:hypothetical protein
VGRDYYKKFWEELIVCFLFALILLSDTTRRNTKLVRMRKVVKSNTIWDELVLVLVMGVICVVRG